MKRIDSLSLAKIFVSGLSIALFSLFVAATTQARSAPAGMGQAKRTIVLLVASNQLDGKILNSPEMKAKILRFVRAVRTNPELLKANPGCCACSPAAQGFAGFGYCMRGCLSDAGVSYYSLVMCGAACGTGAVPICAICVGLSVAVVELCAVGCMIYPNGMKGPGFLEDAPFTRVVPHEKQGPALRELVQTTRAITASR